MNSGNGNNRRLYRSRRGIALGVCRGLAEWSGISLFWLRVVFFIFALATGFWFALFIYVAAALLMKPEPVLPFETPAEKYFYDSVGYSRTAAISRLRDTFTGLDRRIQRLEKHVVSNEQDWRRRLDENLP